MVAVEVLDDERTSTPRCRQGGQILGVVATDPTEASKGHYRLFAFEGVGVVGGVGRVVAG